MRRTLVVLSLLAIAAGCSGEPTEPPPAGDSKTEAVSGVMNVPTTAPATTPPPQPPAIDPVALATVRKYTEMFYEGQLDLLHAKFSEEMRQTVPMEQINLMFEHAVTTYGTETGLIAEEMQTRDDYRAFVRWARFDKTEEIIEIQWILKQNDEIAGFFIRPAKRKVTSQAPVALQP